MVAGRFALAAIMAAGFGCVPAAAGSLQLKPYKDELFAYPKILESKLDGAFRRVEYIEARDINGRDKIPERKAKFDYVSTWVKWYQSTRRVRTPYLVTKFVEVGKQAERPAFIVAYVHGRYGNRYQGSNDWTFGGNFNRIKNLVSDAGGVYLVPDVPDFAGRGAGQVKAMIEVYLKRAPQAPVFVACGSMGGMICWRLAKDENFATRLGGLLMLGTLPDPDYLKSAAYRRKVPIFFAQGSNDNVYSWKGQYALFRRILKGGRPTRFVLFDTGSHGTPIRMTDWREVLNWMLSVKR